MVSDPRVPPTPFANNDKMYNRFVNELQNPATAAEAPDPGNIASQETDPETKKSQ
jgi:hypothetical protein